jgi:hypothetical protein
MGEYLKEEGKEIERLRKAEFTEEQIDALMYFADFKGRWAERYQEDQNKELVKELRKDIRHHRHTGDGGVVRPF